jgi:hypothetical protein
MGIEDWQRGFRGGREFEKRWFPSTLAITILAGLVPAALVVLHGLEVERAANVELERLRAEPTTVYQCGPVGE